MRRAGCALLAVAAIIPGASARCANDCNGKGDCNALNQCDCFPNFRGPDCSFRLCPAGKAFIDTPLGDIDGDGDLGVDLIYSKGVSRQPVSELLHVDYAAARPGFMSTRAWDEAHFYAECSNKGECDPINGICECYPGYDGSACNRNACPDDCNGHGTCKNYEGSSYVGWDVEASTFCECDPRWTGPSCSLRVCRTGVDPVETANVDTSRFQRVAFKAIGPIDWLADDFNMEIYPFGDLFFTLTVEDEYGDEWTTELMTVKYDAFHSTSDDVPDTYFLPRLLNVNETVGKQSRMHVAQTVEDALEALPLNIIGEVTVSEIYSMIGVLHLDGEFDTFTFDATDYAGLSCELTDIYGQTSSRDIVGCGLPTADQYLGVNSGNDRNGELDITTRIDTGTAYIMLVGTGDRYDSLAFDSPIVMDSSTADIQPGTNKQGHKDVGNLADEIFSFGYAYYMYPHYNNEDSAEERFPLMADPGLTTSEFFTEEYSSIFLYDVDADVSALTSASANYLAGLALFIRFEKSTVQTPMRMDYFYASENILLFENYKTSVQGSDWGTFLQMPGMDSVHGPTQEGCTESVCSNDVDIVRIDDIGSRRVWDVLYHGVQKNFLGDGNVGSDAEVHECSKRGICDYSTGICSCFSGYTGLDCNTINALAYGF